MFTWTYVWPSTCIRNGSTSSDYNFPKHVRSLSMRSLIRAYFNTHEICDTETLWEKSRGASSLLIAYLEKLSSLSIRSILSPLSRSLVMLNTREYYVDVICISQPYIFQYYSVLDYAVVFKWVESIPVQSYQWMLFCVRSILDHQ